MSTKIAKTLYAGHRTALIALLSLLLSLPAGAELAVGITRDIQSIEVRHAGQPVTIQRNQDPQAVISAAFQRTSRNCPPFCIQPMQIGAGVETIGELEMFDYLARASQPNSDTLVIDSRGSDWLRHGTIPGSVNIHYRRLGLAAEEPSDIAEILQKQFGVERIGQFWDFRAAKTLVLFCNGPWCGQSPTNIRALLRIGYPPSKLKWYRGGMQSWETLGLTTTHVE